MMPPGYQYLQRYPTGAARESLARRLGLFHHDSMQDWEWEVAEVELLPVLFDTLEQGGLNDDERFSLAEIIVQAVDMLPARPLGQSAEWLRLRAIIQAQPTLHAPTVWYWSCLDGLGEEETEGFSISPAMAGLWKEILPSLAYRPEPA